jgi:hyperosmotically inducible periplasmic protein
MDSYRKRSTLSKVPLLAFVAHFAGVTSPWTALTAASAISAITACRTAEQASLRVDDATITESIRTKLATDSDINPSHIDVTTNHRVVTLEGRAKSQEAREKAELIARQMDGVRRVVNRVKVGDQP